MNLLSPLSLLWFLPLGAIIVALYLLKLRRKEQIVSSVMLWRNAVADIQANAPFQKLKKSLLLILQLTALLLMVLGLARPYMRVRGVRENRIVVIIDCSASMEARDVSPSRLEYAKARAIDLVDKMGPNDAVLLMAAGAKAKVVAPFTSDKNALSSAITGLKPVDTPCNMREAMVLALSLVSGRSSGPARLVLLSDGIFGSLSDLSADNVKLDFVKIGSRCDNVGITSLSSRKTVSGGQQVLVCLQNFSEEPRKFNLELYLKDQLIDVREENLRAGAAKDELLNDVANLSGRITAKLDINDDLDADNNASTYLQGPRRLSVLLISRGDVFLQNALSLDPRTQLSTAESTPSNLESAKYDLVVFDGVSPPGNLPPGGYLLLNTSSPQGPANDAQIVSAPTVVDYARNHPVSRYVDFSGVRIQKACYLSPKPWATTIIDGSGGPLGVAGTKDGRSFVELSWSILDSDFPLQVGFPIFVANCLDWLSPSERAQAGQSVRTGEPASIDVPSNVREITVTDPDGSRHTVAVNQTPVVYENTEHVGVYKVIGRGLQKEFACDLASTRESNTRPADNFAVGTRKFASTGAAVRTNREYYWPLLLTVLGVLAFEWYAYHRRL